MPDTMVKNEIEKLSFIYNEIKSMELKKTLPSEVTNWLSGYSILDRPGIFSEFAEDIISDAAAGNDNLTAWIPAESTDFWWETTAHLSFFTPEGFDGSATYMQHLIDSDDIGECDYGETADYMVHEYQNKLYRMSFSNKSKPMSRVVGLPAHKRDSRKILRGPNAGKTIDNDGEWVLALLTERLEGHVRFDNIWGNPNQGTSNKNMTEGLNEIIQKGYVASHIIGGGDPVWCDPIIINGITVTDPVSQLRMIIAVAAKIIQRMKDRGYTPTANDIGLWMTSTHWRVYSEILAAGALTRLYSTSTNLQITPEAVQRELERVRNSGGIDVLGTFVPVYTNNGLGKNMPLVDGGGFGVVGQVYFLTRYYRGMTILKQRWLNWNSTKLATPPEDRSMPMPTNLPNGLGGMVRTTYGFTDPTYTCWYYGLEMYKGMHCKMYPLQAKFLSFIVPAEIENELESPEWWSENFYAFDGAAGGQGTPLITGLGELT